MSVVIKGMKMPKNGKYILCSIRSDGKVITDLITGGCEEYDVIELSSHGDLIDRDVLGNEIENERLGGYWGESWRELRQIIVDAPTIIEAERGE